MTDPIQISPSATASPLATAERDHADLRRVAQDLEASFLAEMLKQAGFGEARGTFGGGAGEEQFASLIRMEHARALAASGGIGIAEALFESILDRAGVSAEADP